MIENKRGRSSLIDTVGAGLPARKWRAILALALAAILCGAPLGQPLAAATATPRAATSSNATSLAADLSNPAVPAGLPQNTYSDVTQGKGYRFERGGWIYVHLEGSPHDIGFQHGYLLAPEIADAFQVVRLKTTHDTGRDWEFFRARRARDALAEDRSRVSSGTARDRRWLAGSRSEARYLGHRRLERVSRSCPTTTFRGSAKQTGAALSTKLQPFAHCSAFVATGSWTKDHQIVMAHNNWTTYLDGARWNIIFDIVPQQGYRMLMDGFPGVIASDDDFGVNSAGMMVTETTIANFHGWDPNGKPEFARARKAMQYADSIDDYVKIMMDGNNGGYANDWLLGDRKTGEIARFELGLKHTKLWRTMDGYFAGSNFPSDPDVIHDETTFDPDNLASSPNARHVAGIS